MKSVEPFGFGDVLEVRMVFGRIERTSFIVTSSSRVFGDDVEYRYNGVFPGPPMLYGTIYSEDVVAHMDVIPERIFAKMLERPFDGIGFAGVSPARRRST